MPTEFQKIVYQYEAEISDFKKKNKELTDQLKETDKEAGRIEKSFNKVGAAIAAAVTVREIGIFLKEMKDLQIEAQGIQREFDKLNRPGQLEALRKATAGTLSDLQLMQIALKSNEFKIPGTTLAKGLEFARIQAAKLNLTVDQASDKIVDAFGTKSTKALEGLGIGQDELNAKVAETGDFYTAVAEIIDTKLGEGGARTDVELLAESQAKFNAAIQNLRLELSTQLLPVFTQVFEVAGGLVEFVDQLTSLSVAGILEGDFAALDDIQTERAFAASRFARAEKLFLQQIVEGEKTREDVYKGLIDNLREADEEIETLTGSERRLAEVRRDELAILVNQFAPAQQGVNEVLATQLELMSELADTFDSDGSSKYWTSLLKQTEEVFERLEKATEAARKFDAAFRQASDADFEAAAGEDVEDPFDTAAFLEAQEIQAESEEEALSRIEEFTAAQEQAILSGFGSLADGIGSIFGVTAENSAAFLAFQKLLAVAEILINLQKEISALAASTAVLGPLQAAALAPAVTAASIRAGLAVATVAATAIPQFAGFAEGTASAPGGIAWVGEEGPEKMFVPKGAAIFTNKASTQHTDMINALNDGTIDQFINSHYIMPALAAMSQGERFDDSNIVRALRNNEVRLHPSSQRAMAREIAKLNNRNSQRWH